MQDYHVSRGGVSRRSTVRFMTEPSHEISEIRAVTPAGELMAAVLAYARLLRLNPDVRISGVEVTEIEDEFTIDPATTVSTTGTRTRTGRQSDAGAPAMRPDELERRLRERLDALGPAPRAECSTS
jgi:hypothetical protein